QFDDARVQRADVQAFMPKVRMFVHPEQTSRECLPTRFSEVTMTLTDGRTLTQRITHAKGQPKNPLTDAELDAKFRDCAIRVLPADRVESLLASIRALQTVPDVRALAAQFATRG